MIVILWSQQSCTFTERLQLQAFRALLVWSHRWLYSSHAHRNHKYVWELVCIEFVLPVDPFYLFQQKSGPKSDTVRSGGRSKYVLYLFLIDQNAGGTPGFSQRPLFLVILQTWKLNFLFVLAASVGTCNDVKLWFSVKSTQILNYFGFFCSSSDSIYN